MKDYFAWEKEYSIPISALQHYSYCPRQFALIHIEEIYEENIFTIEGNIVHEKVDDSNNYRSNKKCENSVPVWSDKLGIYGVVDILEYEGDKLYPVEYKRGKKKKRLANQVQVCAQVLCLEEMKEVDIDCAYIYYESSRRRKEIEIKSKIRTQTQTVIRKVKEMLEKRITPEPEYTSKCDNCSLNELCLPKAKIKEEKYRKSFK